MSGSVEDNLKKYNKSYENNVSFMDVSQYSGLGPPERIPTGLFPFDYGIGGGFPRGLISLLYGLEGCGKTTLLLKAIASAQRMFPDHKAVFVDLEGHFDYDWAEQCGVDLQKLGFIAPPHAEAAIDMCVDLLYADNLSIIGVDSLAAMITEKELGSAAEEIPVGKTGLAINKFYRKAGRALGQSKLNGNMPTMLCINQIRYKMTTMGDPETMPGGPSFKFAAKLVVRVTGKDEMVNSNNSDLPTYKKITARVKKAKLKINQQQFETLMALQPVPLYGLKTTESYDWNMVLGKMKDFEMIQKHQPKGWDVIWFDTGEVETFDKQDDIKDKFFSDPEYAFRLKKVLVDRSLNLQGFNPDEEEVGAVGES